MTHLTHLFLLAPIVLFLVGTPVLLWAFAES